MFVAEYKDVSKIERKEANIKELRANIYKERTMIKLNNQVIENFLQEIVIMRQFDHPNVLSLIGISVHNNNSCAILPLMTNKDLKLVSKHVVKVSKRKSLSKLHYMK